MGSVAPLRRQEPDSPVEARFAAFANQAAHQVNPIPEAQSFAEAAVGFLETWSPPTDEPGQITVTVIDRRSGERESFTLELQ